MSIVRFENPPGEELATRQFEPGQDLRIVVKPMGFLGIPEPFIECRIELFNSFAPYYWDVRSNLFGTAYVDLVLPDMITQATVKVTIFWIGSVEIVTIPIAIGTTPAPIPEPPGGIIESTLKWVAIGAGMIALVYLASKAYPSVKRAVTYRPAITTKT